MVKRTILLVDDDLTLRELLGDALELQGFTILHAGNGEEGVAAALAGKPDLVISDIVMPGMNGWELCQTLRTLPATRAVPFLFLSSLDQSPDRLRALRLGADDYLTKPFHLATVLAKVQRLIGRVEQGEKEGSCPNLPANVEIPWKEFTVSLLAQGGEDTHSS